MRHHRPTSADARMNPAGSPLPCGLADSHVGSCAVSSPRVRGEGLGIGTIPPPLAGGETRRRIDPAGIDPRVRGRFRKSLIRRRPLTLALRAPFAPDKGCEGLSPHAGRGDPASHAAMCECGIPCGRGAGDRRSRMGSEIPREGPGRVPQEGGTLPRPAPCFVPEPDPFRSPHHAPRFTAAPSRGPLRDLRSPCPSPAREKGSPRPLWVPPEVAQLSSPRTRREGFPALHPAPCRSGAEPLLNTPRRCAAAPSCRSSW